MQAQHRTQSPQRRRRVRFSYPQPMVDLTALLCRRFDRIAVARCLALPLSTVYRWCAAARNVSAPAEDEFRPRLDELLAACQGYGFDLRSAVQALAPGTAASAIAPPTRARAPNIRMVEMARPESWPDRTASLAQRIDAVHARIRACYWSDLSCDYLASGAGISKYALIRLFKARFGITPHRYLMHVRIEQTKVLLQSAGLSFDAVATAVGFDSLSSLCKAFKSIEGISLSRHFRGLNLESAAARVVSTPRAA